MILTFRRSPRQTEATRALGLFQRFLKPHRLPVMPVGGRDVTGVRRQQSTRDPGPDISLILQSSIYAPLFANKSQLLDTFPPPLPSGRLCWL